MSRISHDRHFPVRPNLDQLKHQAKDLLRAIHEGDSGAIAELRKHHPKPSIEPANAKLADAQAALARSYGLQSWPRLVTACRMTDAIWRGDEAAVRELVLKDPRLLYESARGIADSNWGRSNVVRRKRWPRRHHRHAARKWARTICNMPSIAPACKAGSKPLAACMRWAQRPGAGLRDGPVRNAER